MDEATQRQILKDIATLKRDTVRLRTGEVVDDTVDALEIATSDDANVANIEGRRGLLLPGVGEEVAMLAYGQGGLLVLGRIGGPEPVREVGGAGEPAFNTGWGNGGAGHTDTSFFRDGFGVVHLEGTVTRSSGAATTIFTLPVGYRPSGLAYFPCVASDGVFGSIRIQTNGNVEFFTGNVALMALNGISFRAAA